MNALVRLFLQGIAAILPVFLTAYLVIALLVWLERGIHSVMLSVLPDSLYIPGMGIVLSFFAVIAVGYLIQLPVLNLPVRLGEAIFKRLPLVKSLYKAIQDVADFVGSMREPNDGKGDPVLVQITPDTRVIGFITQSAPEFADADEHSLVYMPMSYQVGGYTALVKKSQLQPLNIPAEDAMRFVLTAGLNTSGSSNKVNNSLKDGEAS